jgi:5-oxoprolinase (ATP-hydrolysing) subunit A
VQTTVIDINVDVGEGINNESFLMPYISSCNIACGGHAGDLETMRYVVSLAKKHSVKIGAHPSFPDKQNFGRKTMDISCAVLFTSIKDQIDNLIIVLKEEQVRLNHIKPHGALYNLAAVDPNIAEVIIEVMKCFILPIKLYVPYNSVIEKLAIKNNIPIKYEAFADRNYNDDGTLVSRTDDHAIIDNSVEMFEHVYRMIISKKVKTITGYEIDIIANTFCVHGDHPNAVILLKDLKNKLAEKGIQIR